MFSCASQIVYRPLSIVNFLSIFVVLIIFILIMNEDKSQLIRFAMQFGLIFGLYWCLNLILMILGNFLPLLNLICLPLIFLVPFIAYRFTIAYRRMALNDQIGVFHAWQFGNLLYFFASLIVSLPCYFLFRYLSATGYFTNMLHEVTALADKFHMNKADIESSFEMLNSPIKMTMQVIFSSVFWGIILSIPVAFIARKKNV